MYRLAKLQLDQVTFLCYNSPEPHDNVTDCQWMMSCNSRVNHWTPPPDPVTSSRSALNNSITFYYYDYPPSMPHRKRKLDVREKAGPRRHDPQGARAGLLTWLWSQADNLGEMSKLYRFRKLRSRIESAVGGNIVNIFHTAQQRVKCKLGIA